MLLTCPGTLAVQSRLSTPLRPRGVNRGLGRKGRARGHTAVGGGAAARAAPEQAHHARCSWERAGSRQDGHHAPQAPFTRVAEHVS